MKILSTVTAWSAAHAWHWALWAGLISSMLGLAPAHAEPKRIALLVGVGSYPGFPQKYQLAGPKPDVEALSDVLAGRWGFQAADIKTLVNNQATKAAIMQELRALAGRSKPGDDILVYFSGHGISALSGLAIPVPHGSGAFVPYDANPNKPDFIGGLIVGRTDFVPVFSALEQSGRKLWVISDSCYSGMQIRSPQLSGNDESPARTIPIVLDPAEIEKQRIRMGLAANAPAITPYPYRTVAFLAASAEGEKALDISGPGMKNTPTHDDQAHGAFTDALLRVLKGKIPGDLDGDGLLSLNEVHRATLDFMAQRAYSHTPQRLPSVAEDAQGVGTAPVLSMRNVAAKPTQPAPEPLRVVPLGLSAPLLRVLAGVPDVVVVKQGAATDISLTEEKGRVKVIAASGDLLADMDAVSAPVMAAQVRQLAWAKRLRLLAERHRRGALQMDVDPSLMGGNFVIGSKIAFVVRPDKAATLVLLNISSDGKVSVLYPERAGEAKPLAANASAFIPGNEEHLRIKVQEPLGMDLLFAFAFDTPPAGLEKMYHALDLDPADARLAVLEGWLASMSSKFTFATASLRTLAKPPPKATP